MPHAERKNKRCRDNKEQIRRRGFDSRLGRNMSYSWPRVKISCINSSKLGHHLCLMRWHSGSFLVLYENRGFFISSSGQKVVLPHLSAFADRLPKLHRLSAHR